MRFPRNLLLIPKIHGGNPSMWLVRKVRIEKLFATDNYFLIVKCALYMYTQDAEVTKSLEIIFNLEVFNLG